MTPADGGGDSPAGPVEYVLWGIPKGQTDDLHAQVLYTQGKTEDDIERVKAQAAKDGWHSFRVQRLDLSQQMTPDQFAAAVGSGPDAVQAVPLARLDKLPTADLIAQYELAIHHPQRYTHMRVQQRINRIVDLLDKRADKDDPVALRWFDDVKDADQKDRQTPVSKVPNTPVTRWTKQQAVATDEKIAATYMDWFTASMRVRQLEADLKRQQERLTKAEATYAGQPDHYNLRAIQRSVAEFQKRLAQETAQRDEKRLAYDRAAQDYQGWPRAFLVVTNGKGHVHKSMSCSTCYPTTQFHWVTEYSGASEDDIVAAAGERACTVCYPSAPTDVLSRPTQMLTAEEREALARKAEKDAKKAAQGLTE